MFKWYTIFFLDQISYEEFVYLIFCPICDFSVGNMIFRTLLFLLAFMVTNSVAVMDKKTYIIHMDKTKIKASIHSQDNTKPWFKSVVDFISEASLEEDIAPQLLYVYETSMFGFAAQLSNKQIEYLNQIDGFLSAIPDELLTLHTTYSIPFSILITCKPFICFIRTI